MKLAYPILTILIVIGGAASWVFNPLSSNRSINNSSADNELTANIKPAQEPGVDPQADPQRAIHEAPSALSNPWGEALLKDNVIRNSDFEEADPYGAPADFGYYSSVYQFQNLSYHENHAGNYGALIEGQATKQQELGNPTSYGNGPYIGQEIYYINDGWLGSSSAYLNGSLDLDIWYNILQNPAVQAGGQVYLQVNIRNSTDSFNIYYVLSHGSSFPSTNSTNPNRGFLLLNTSTFGSWTYLYRNVTQDFDDLFAGRTQSLYVSSLYFSLYSPQNQELMQLVIDDISIRNSTTDEFLTDRGFESVSSGSYWYSWGLQAPGSVSLTADGLDGQAANLSLSNLGKENFWGQADLTVGYSFGGSYAMGLYATASGAVLIEFDWKYNDTWNGGTNQYAYLQMSARNSTGGSSLDNYYSFYFLLGAATDTNPITNATDTFSFNATGFGTRGSWQHQAIDVSDLFQALGVSEVALYNFQFQIYCGYRANSSIQLLVDNFEVITYPAYDPGFEEDWFSTTTSPITSWMPWGSPTPSELNYTAEANNGSWALNITKAGSSGNVGVYRDTYVPIVPDTYADFWWKLNRTTGYSYSYSRLQIEGAIGVVSLYYVFGVSENDFSGWNSSAEVYYLVDHYNDAGSWFHLFRNLYTDLEYFGPISLFNWSLTRIYLIAYASSPGESSICFDDIHFLKDTHTPTIHSVTWTSSPSYHEPVEVQIDATDGFSGVDFARIYYRQAGEISWSFASTTFLSGFYVGAIPAFPYGSSILFYVAVNDLGRNTAVDDNGGTYYSYTVGDLVLPDVAITFPYPEDEIQGTITITADVADPGSSVLYVEIYDNSTLLVNDSSAPYAYAWNTRTVANGNHTLNATAYDGAGNSASHSVKITVANDISPPVLSSIQLSPPSPGPNQPVEILVGVFDASPLVNVTLHYKIGSGSWQAVLMNTSNALYSAEIPGAPWNAAVLYYIVAIDSFYQQATAGSLASPFSYTVGSSLAAPELSSVQINPSAPQYNQVVQVSAAVSNSTNLASVTLYYQTGSAGWQNVLMNTSGALYYSTIPGAPWNTVVSYYIVVIDSSSQQSSAGIQASPLSYTVGDTVLPVLSVAGPPTSTPLLGTVDFSISGYDEGSDINQLEVLVGGEVVWSATSLPATFSWDTTTVDNGVHTLTFRLSDNAGNSIDTEVEYEVDNPEGLDAIGYEFDLFLQNNGFVAGVGAIIGLYALLKLFLWRRGRGGST
ncbi:MAG: Ig-like domain-containing protein [Candidatus Thorarchaeota archaeon]